jgi:hypothetical protein
LTQLFDVLKFSAFLQGADEGGREDFVRKSHFFIYRRWRKFLQGLLREAVVTLIEKDRSSQ